MRIQLPLFDCAPDVIAADAAPGIWTRAEGVQFRAGMAERVAPMVHLYEIGEPAGPYLAIASVQNAAGEFYWVVATTAGVFSCDGVQWADITPTLWAATDESIITMHGFNGALIINDSISGPFYWTVAAGVKAARLPAWPTGWRVVSMRSHAGFLFGIGRLDMGGVQRVVWSDAAEAGTLPGSWEPTAENMAGWVDLLPAVSPCVDGISVGNEFLVFKGQGVHAFTFTAGQEIFTVRMRFARVGLASVGGFCRGPSERVLFAGSHGDVLVTDGVSYDSVLTGKGQRAWYDEVEPSAFRGLIQGATLSRLGLALMYFAAQGADRMTRALVYDWGTGAISWRDMPAGLSIGEGRVVQDTSKNAWNDDAGTWASDGSVWNGELTGATGDDVCVGGDGLWLVSDQNRADGTAAPVYLFKQGAALGLEESHKLIRRVFPRIRGRGSVTVRVGASAEAEGPVEWSDAVTFPIAAGAHVDLFRRGRFVSLEISSQDASPEGFQVGSVELDAVESGKW